MRDTEIDPEIDEIEQLNKENKRLHHLTTVLIEHIWKGGGLPLKHIDKQMELFDAKEVVYRDVLSGDIL
jgi:hypothetical protein|tara:strand:- start:512 stop:718 length:207 start_codon:yes stop_codon:yes gene_type:complete